MSHFIADDGAKIHIKDTGDGPAIVMLHGWTSSHQEWFPFLPLLTGKHRVIRWDARAHGGQHHQNHMAPTVSRMARDLANMLEHLNLDEVTAVGHSMGALTLWQYIRDFGRQRLARACFIDQSPKLVTDVDWRHGIYGNFDHRQAAELLSGLKADFPEGVLKLTAFGLNQRAREKYLAGASGWERSRQQLRQQNPTPLIECWESLTQADYRAVLSTIDIPSMLVYGAESNFYSVETAHYVANQIRNAILHIYEGTDHSAHQWQRERFARELTQFIDET